jgi:hypothetical protein
LGFKGLLVLINVHTPKISCKLLGRAQIFFLQKVDNTKNVEFLWFSKSLVPVENKKPLKKVTSKNL